MGHTQESPATGEHHEHHPGPIVYITTYFILLGLLALTVGAYYLDLSRITHWVGTNLIVALIIAIAKAALVVLFFMNVKGSTRLTWLWAALGFIWLLLMSGVFMDYLTRGLTAPQGWTS